MRILQVCNDYYPALGGLGLYVKNLSERLAREHEVTVFSADRLAALPREEQVNGVVVRRFQSFSPGNAYYFSLELLRELRESRFDIVHGHNYHAIPLLFSRCAGRQRFIVSPHYHRYGTTVLRRALISIYKPLGGRALREADRIIAASRHEKSLLVSDFGVDGDRIAVIPHGVNAEEFRSLKRTKRDHRTMLCVARLERFKGVQHVIRALPLLDEDIRLEIVGEGPYERDLVRLAARLRVQHRTDFLHCLSGAELLERYAGADLFIMLSERENYGMAVAEALAAGVPCIVAARSALVDWVDDSACFGIEHPADFQDLAGLIGRVIGRTVENTSLRDWEDVVEESMSVYFDEKGTGKER